MDFETAKKAVDFYLSMPPKNPGVIWEIIGGEPFLEIDLVDKITDYITERIKGHPWENNYIFATTTNGTLFGDPKVRAYCEKDRCHKSIGLSLDGVKEIHDYNRSNSFDKVMENYDWWHNTYPWCPVKSTLNHEALPYIYESTKFLVEHGMFYITMNTANEDIWQEDDEKIYYDQLIKVADYLLEDKRYEKIYTALFDDKLFTPANKASAWCGCGSCMIAADYKGDLFPCLRFKTLSKQEPWTIGNINTGIDRNKLLPFYFCHNIRESECVTCESSSGCASCLALNYDATGTVFKRVSYICKLHKARIEANRYFFSKIKELEGEA
jgi:radical SAM peptide maturase (CXXX-repeat target family)